MLPSFPPFLPPTTISPWLSLPHDSLFSLSRLTHTPRNLNINHRIPASTLSLLIVTWLHDSGTVDGQTSSIRGSLGLPSSKFQHSSLRHCRRCSRCLGPEGCCEGDLDREW
ncbi:hypothetical protein PM082_014025 [Marasmius tenuissimus]|nr:hypothetical protein PM082_014025 [Marasmius tenuissimus]